MIDIIEKLAQKNILVTVSSGMQDAINGYGFRFVPYIKIVKVTNECANGCGENGQNYKGEIHNSNCKWEQREYLLFSDFVEKEDVLNTLSSYLSPPNPPHSNS